METATFFRHWLKLAVRGNTSGCNTIGGNNRKLKAAIQTHILSAAAAEAKKGTWNCRFPFCWSCFEFVLEVVSASFKTISVHWDMDVEIAPELLDGAHWACKLYGRREDDLMAILLALLIFTQTRSWYGKTTSTSMNSSGLILALPLLRSGIVGDPHTKPGNE